MPGIFGDVLSGLAKANHEHQLNLMEMEHDEAKRKSALFAELAQSPNFEPQQQEWFLKAAIAHLTDPKEAKKYDIKNGMVQIPADIIKPKQPAAADLAAEQQPFQIPALTYGAPTPGAEGEPAIPGALQPRAPTPLRIPGTAAANPALIAPVAPPPELRSVAQPISQQTRAFRALEQARQLQAMKDEPTEIEKANAERLSKQQEANAAHQRALELHQKEIDRLTAERDALAEKNKGPSTVETDEGISVWDAAKGKYVLDPTLGRKIPANPAATPNLGQTEGLLDGKLVFAAHDPKTGKYLNPATGEDITGRFTPKTSTTGGLTAAQEAAAARAEDSRLDRSYQLNVKELDDLQKPVTDGLMRLGRLQDTLAQGTFQADALFGPEFLTAMAGGQGSGLRMNEAEISRIVGGRTAWDDLRARLQKWGVVGDRALTPNQIDAASKLVTEVKKKLEDKAAAATAAHQSLIDGKTVDDHRKAVLGVRQTFQSIDSGKQPAAGGASGGTVIEWEKGPDGVPRPKAKAK